MELNTDCRTRMRPFAIAAAVCFLLCVFAEVVLYFCDMYTYTYSMPGYLSVCHVVRMAGFILLAAAMFMRRPGAKPVIIGFILLALERFSLCLYRGMLTLRFGLVTRALIFSYYIVPVIAGALMVFFTVWACLYRRQSELLPRLWFLPPVLYGVYGLWQAGTRIRSLIAMLSYHAGDLTSSWAVTAQYIFLVAALVLFGLCMKFPQKEKNPFDYTIYT